MKDDLLIGVIGSGGRGALARSFHMPGKGARVVACCDIDDDTLVRNREWYGANVFATPDYRVLLKQNLAAVFVTTPDYLHEEHAVAALEGGKVSNSPVAARYSVVAGCCATKSLRNGGIPVEMPELDPELAAWFD